jgi:hypothetical protein
MIAVRVAYQLGAARDISARADPDRPENASRLTDRLSPSGPNRLKFADSGPNFASGTSWRSTNYNRYI